MPPSQVAGVPVGCGGLASSPHSFDTAHGSQKALVENYRPTLPSAVFGATRVKEGKVRRGMENRLE